MSDRPHKRPRRKPRIPRKKPPKLKKWGTRLYGAGGGEMLCSVAIRFGFKNCTKVRNANPDLAHKKQLDKGDAVIIPPITTKSDLGEVEQLHTFYRPKFPPPRVEFIKEEGYGYGRNTDNLPPLPGSGLTQVGGPRPDLDPKRSTLAISNYISDRSGDSRDRGCFPPSGLYGYEWEERASQDPDHFKVQVYDNGVPDGVDEVTVTLYAMQPTYYETTANNKTVVRQNPDAYIRPQKGSNRTLRVVCERIEGTHYFRSLYLRLVTYESSQAKIKQSALLVSDYWDEGPLNGDKHYTEILHQCVEAVYEQEHCEAKLCSTSATAKIDRGLALHLAVYVLEHVAGGRNQLETYKNDKLLPAIYKHLRRIYAPAHVRPVIEHLQCVPAPKNILAVANDARTLLGGLVTLGKANGLNRHGRPSVMKFKVDGYEVTHSPKSGMSPKKTAGQLAKAIRAHPRLRTYRTTIKQASGTNPKVNPYDVLVFKSDRTPAELTDVESTDVRQSLLGVTQADYNTFEVLLWPASPVMRALRWTYSKARCLNVYVCSRDPLEGSGPLQGTQALGIGPPGKVKGFRTDVGPCIYLCDLAFGGVQGQDIPTTLAHETGHVAMHVFHASEPLTDRGVGGLRSGRTQPAAEARRMLQIAEIMSPGAGGRSNERDTHDCSRHISDAPIKAKYTLPEIDDQGFVPLDGVTRPARNVGPTTPVRRLHQIGMALGFLRDGPVPLDPAVTDLPKSKQEAAARALQNAQVS